MSYDFIVIGGGIAGLYTTYNILKKRPHSKIILLEKENHLGGRIHTFTDDYMSVEAGAGRFHQNNKLLLELIRELGLSSKINQIASTASYAPIDCCGNFMNSVLDAPHGDGGIWDDGIFLPFSFNLLNPIFSLTLDIILGKENIPNAELILRVIVASKGEHVSKLRNMSFISYAKTILTNIEIDFIQSSFGYYSELIIMNAYDAIYLMEKHLSPIHPFYVLKGGLSQIIDILENKIMKFHNVRIIKGCDVNSIVFSKKENEFIIHCEKNKKVHYNATKCICALPKPALEKFSIFRDIRGLFDKVECSPLCRIYSKFPLRHGGGGGTEPWFKGLTKLTTNNNLRMIIPMDEENGIIMSSYTDNKFARFWKELFDKEGEQGLNKELVRLLQQSTGLDIDEPKIIDDLINAAAALHNDQCD